MHYILTIYHTLQLHPLYWQTPVGLIGTSGVFEYVKRKLALEGSKKITGYLSLVATLVVIVHLAIVGATVAGPLGIVKLTAQQSLVFIGGLNLVYNFLTHGATQFLQEAKAQANTPPAIKNALTALTPVQKNPTSNTDQAAAAGVVNF